MKTMTQNKFSPKAFCRFFLLLGICLAVFLSAGCAKENTAGSVLTDSRIAYIGSAGLYSAEMTGENNQKLVSGNTLSSPLFSGDGTALAYLNGKDLYAYDFNAKKSALLLTAANSYCAGADSSFYASSPTEGLRLIENQGAKKTVLLTPLGVGLRSEQTDPPSTDSSVIKQGPGPIKSAQVSQLLASDLSEGRNLEYNNLTPSPDFKHLAFNIYVRNENMAYSGGLWIMDTATGEFTLAATGKKSADAEIGPDPCPGKFSPDGKTLFVWLRPASASLSADGVDYGLYDLASKKLTSASPADKSLSSVALAYDENVSFYDTGSFALLAGGDRMMDSGKSLQMVSYTASSIKEEGIPTGKLIPAMPNLSKDAKSLYFAAFSGQGPTSSAQIHPIKRQLYVYSNGNITSLTNDTTYLCESPHLLNDNAHLLFGRINNKTNEMGLWLINTDGSKAQQLANWPMPNESSELYNDYYGRGNWDGLMAFYDATR
jgi:hypothetical protein